MCLQNCFWGPLQESFSKSLEESILQKSRQESFLRSLFRIPQLILLEIILRVILILPAGVPFGTHPSGSAPRHVSRDDTRNASGRTALESAKDASWMPKWCLCECFQGCLQELRNSFLIIPLEICARNLFTDPSRNSERYPSKIPFRSPFRKEKSLGMYFRNAPRNSSRMFLAISLVMLLGVPPGILQDCLSSCSEGIHLRILSGLPLSIGIPVGLPFQESSRYHWESLKRNPLGLPSRYPSML